MFMYSMPPLVPSLCGPTKDIEYLIRSCKHDCCIPSASTPDVITPGITNVFCQADRYVAFVDGATLHGAWNTDDVKIVGIVEVSGFKVLGIVQDADCRT